MRGDTSHEVLEEDECQTISHPATAAADGAAFAFD
jgi:hypothetical protein